MDLQQFVDRIEAMTCVMSVEEKEDGSCGEIRIVTGNKAYIDSIENPGSDAPRLMTDRFEPGSLYERYFPKDLNFELFCFNCAVKKQPVHTYVHPERFNFWFDIYMLPIGREGRIHYCTYTQVITRQAESDKMAGISRDTAGSVLNICIKLRGVRDAALFESTLTSVIRDLRDLSKARNCAVLLLDHENKSCRVMSEAVRTTEDQSEERKSSAPDFYDVVLTWDRTIGGSNCLIIQDPADMEYVRERNPVWYRSLTAARVQSLVIFPLKSGETLLGYIWATNFDTVHTLHIKETLELATYFIASEIANYMLLTRLKALSSMDLLTGIMNRNEMNNRIDDLREGRARIEHLGVVFADLNGLKHVNDQYGHVEGDTMLKDGAAQLRQVFAGDEIYRAGGDEFMVLTRGRDEAELLKNCEELKQLASRCSHVSFATGCCVVEDSTEIRKALKTADERMYRDKESFYLNHPDLKR